MTRSTWFLLIAVLTCGTFIFLDRGRNATDRVRQKTLQAFKIDDTTCNYLRFERDDLTIECQKREGLWYLSQPEGARARSGAIERIISRLRAFETGAEITEEDRLKQGSELEDFGLLRPAVRFAVGDRAAPVRIDIGSPTALGSQIYVRPEGSSTILAVSSDILQLIPADPSELRDRGINFPGPGQLIQLEIQPDDGFLRLDKSEKGSWSMTQPIEARVDEEAYLALLNRLASVKVDQFIAENPESLETYGLEMPQAELRWSSLNREFDDTLQLGNVMADNPDTTVNESKFMYARLGSLPTVFTVSAGLLELASTKVDDLRDKRVLPFDPPDVVAIRIINGEDVVTVERQSNHWMMVEPVQTLAESTRIRQLLNDWCAARIFRFVPGNPLVDKPPPDRPPTELVFQREDTTVAEAGPGDVETLPTGDLFHLKLHHGRAKEGLMLIESPADKSFSEIPYGLMASLSLQPLQYRSHEVLSLGAGDIIDITRVMNGATQKIVRAEGGWRSSEENQPVNLASLGGLLGECQHLVAVELVKLDPTPSELPTYGLDQPVLNLILGVRARVGIRKTLLIGNPGGGARHYGMITGQDLVFLVKPDTLDRLKAPLVSP